MGFQMGFRMKKEPVLSALERAYQTHRSASEVLHHSDRGSQYAAQKHQKKLVEYGMKVSMSRKRNCYDNVCIESFHSILKKELVYLEHFKTREEYISFTWSSTA
ncbi:DDE-type integrase/transposase/recombinase [Paenibacillus sp. IHB B 3084]|uniref:DDE-type integrase/transposase/recombinase n=1 Tax=Paenibacillus sp. IHB B 3084 TaxID=867076 RepID=UPI00214E8328|nr:DDE-type integrase/transposase/recombinase [Paenibacillus sp. IHB B 3084]